MNENVVKVKDDKNIDTIYNAIFCGSAFLVVLLLSPFFILFFHYLAYQLENYFSVKNNFSEFNRNDHRLLTIFSGKEVSSSSLSYRFNQPYQDDEFFSCYVNFFEITSELNEDKIKKFYPNELKFVDLSTIYSKWESPERCVGQAISYPINEIEKKWIAPGFSYIRQIKSGYENFDLLVKGSLGRIELSTLAAENAKIFVAEYPKENAYRALVLYPNKKVVKMVTACAGFTEFCGEH